MSEKAAFVRKSQPWLTKAEVWALADKCLEPIRKAMRDA